MNYIELIRGFWRSHERHSFNTTDIALYFHLVEICNICTWENPFKRNNARICADLSITLNTLKNARNKLKQANLIDFDSMQGNANVKYELKESRSSKFDEVGIDVDSDVSVEVVTKLPPIKDKHKLNKTFKIKEREVFVEEKYLQVLSEMQNDRIWSDPLCMNTQTTPKEFQEKLIEFFVLRTNEGLVEVPILKECRQHFANWLRVSKQQSQKGGNNVVQSQQPVNTPIKLHPRLQQS